MTADGFHSRLENAHCLALETLDLVDYADSGTERYITAKTVKEADRTAELLNRITDISRDLRRELHELGEPFIRPDVPVAREGDFFAESAHNLVAEMAICLACDIEYSVADEYITSHEEITIAVPPSRENLRVKLDLAVAAFRESPARPGIEAMNRLRAECRREYIIVSRPHGLAVAVRRDDDRNLPKVHGIASAQGTLAKLMALPAETEWLEFKEARNSFDFEDLGRYFSAISNEANLKGQRCGWLIFGVTDRSPRQVVGTQYKRHRPALDSVKKAMADQTNNHLTFEEIYEVILPEGRVLMFQIPPALRAMPTAFKGHFYGRDNESLGALNLHELERIRSQ